MGMSKMGDLVVDSLWDNDGNKVVGGEVKKLKALKTKDLEGTPEELMEQAKVVNAILNVLKERGFIKM